MGVVAISFGIAAALAVALSLRMGRRHPSFAAALMLVAFWGVANLTDPWMDPWMDAVGFYAALMIWLLYGGRWPVVLGAAFLAQMVVSLTLYNRPVTRMLLLNVLFAVEIAAVAFPGMLDALEPVLRRCGVPLGHARHLGFSRCKTPSAR